MGVLVDGEWRVDGKFPADTKGHFVRAETAEDVPASLQARVDTFCRRPLRHGMTEHCKGPKTTRS